MPGNQIFVARRGSVSLTIRAVKANESRTLFLSILFIPRKYYLFRNLKRIYLLKINFKFLKFYNND